VDEDTVSTMAANKSHIEKDGNMIQQNKKKSGLFSVPTEVISQIGGYLTSDKDVAAFAGTCKLFNTMFGDVLYQRNEMYSEASCLTWAAKKDRVETLKRAIKAGICLENHSYLIFVVSCHGSSKVARLVLSLPGVDLMAEDKRGWTPITLAASHGYTNIIRTLIDNGADFRAPTRGGWSPINVACSRGRLDVAKLLLDEYGASMKSDENFGWSPLRTASVFGQAKMICYLIQRGADVSELSETGWTCLHAAVEAGHARAVAELIEHGLDPMAVTEIGWTPLIIATERGHDTIVLQLLDRGADIEQPCKNLWTPLCMAASRGDFHMCKILLSRGANIAAQAMGGWFPLSLAASNGHDPAVNLLTLCGADIRMTNDNGWTPLMAAAANGHSSTALILIHKGSHVEAKSKNGSTALMCAADGRHLHTAKLLLFYGANVMTSSGAGQTVGTRAAQSGGIQLLSLFRTIPGFDLNHVDNQGRSLVFHAAMRGHARLVKILLPLVSTPEKRDQYGTSPIFVAARNGQRKVVELLIKKGYADFEERDFLGCTLLAWAQRSKRRQFVRFLKKYTQVANIPVWPEDPAGERTQYKYDREKCLCSICCRTSLHWEKAYECDDCNGGMLICAECIDAGMKCEDSSHTWRPHRCIWNHDQKRNIAELLNATGNQICMVPARPTRVP
jgi:ankyrin repeat protein